MKKPKVLGYLIRVGRESIEKSYEGHDYILIDGLKETKRQLERTKKDYPTVKTFKILAVYAQELGDA